MNRTGTKRNKGSLDKLSELPEADQDRQVLHRSEPLERDRGREDTGTSPQRRGRSRSRPVTALKQERRIDREHLECCVCGTGVQRSDLYLLSCCHSLCLGCVRIEEGLYKCPGDTCQAVASVKDGELRANLLSRDYKRVSELARRGERTVTPLCESCYTSPSLPASHLCMECDRLMCHVCVDIHNRGDGTHLVGRTEELRGCEVEQLMADTQHRLQVCRSHGNRAQNHFCTQCDAFLCDGCLVGEHRQHATVSVQDRLSYLKSSFLSHIRTCYEYSLDMTQRKQKLELRRDSVLLQEQVLVQKIADCYEEMARQVEAKRDQLIRKARRHFSRSKMEIEQGIEQLEREISQLVRSNTYLTSSAQLCSVRTLEENMSQLIQPCSLLPYSDLLARDTPSCPPLKLKLTPGIESAIRESGSLRIALDYSQIREDQLTDILTRPYAVVADSTDRLLVADGPERSIQVFREGNRLCQIYDEDNLSYPWGLCVSEESLFVTDGVQHSLLKYSLDGTFLKKAGLLGDGKEELNNPMGLCCGQLVYVCDSWNNRLQVWSQQLEWKRSIGQGKLLYPRDSSLTPEDMLVVLDEGNPCLHLYNLKGNLVANYGSRGPDKTFLNPFFIATDGDGGIVVSDYGADSVKILSLSDGKVSHVLDRNLTGKGPGGVFVDSNGSILLSCSVSKQLIRFCFDK